MSVTVLIPTALRQFTEDRSEVSLDAQTVGQALNALAETYLDLKRHLFHDGTLRNFVNVYVNEDDIRGASGLDTPVKAGDTVILVPSIAGGRRG